MTEAEGGIHLPPPLIFDVDGTLCDTCDVDDECFVRACREAAGLDARGVDWSAAPHVTDAGIVHWLTTLQKGRPPRKEEIRAIQVIFLALLEEELSQAPQRFAAIPGAPALLARLQMEQRPFVAATGGWRATAQLKLAAAGISPEVLAASSDDFAERVQVFQAAARTVASAKQPVILVGDGVWDVEVARRLRWSFIGIGAGEKAERLRRAGADAILPDLADPQKFDTLAARGGRQCAGRAGPVPVLPRPDQVL